MAALDCFVRDVYGEQRILSDRVLPRELVAGSPSFLRAAAGPAARTGPQVCVAGIDLVRVDGRWLVLEDNLRVPSGVAYSLAARRASVELLTEEMAEARPISVAEYPRRLAAELARRGAGAGTPVLLTPGPANPAYYEHRELARLLRVPLVTGDQLIASHRGCWWMDGPSPRPVSAIYHRYSPEYLDPVATPETVIGSAFLLTAGVAPNMLVGGERDGPGSARRPVRGGAAGRLRRPSGAAGSVAWGLRRVVARQLPGAGPETLVGRCRPIAGGGGTVVEGGGPRGGGPGRARPGETEAAEQLLQLLGAAEVLLDPLGKAREEVGELRVAGQLVLEAAELGEEVAHGRLLGDLHQHGLRGGGGHRLGLLTDNLEALAAQAGALVLAAAEL